MAQPNIGFIGLGRMGAAIAGRLCAAGYDLTVWNRSPGKADAIVDQGARAVGSVAEACAGVEIAMTMLADDAALRQVALGEGGLVSSLDHGAIHVVMGTHGVEAIAELARSHASRGQTLVAAPVLGRPDAAAAGALGVVVAGPPAAVERVLPLLATFGRRTFEVGERVESAAAIKLANNLTLGCAIETMAEAFALVRGYGVEPSAFHDVLTDGLFAAPAYSVYGRIIVDEAYDQVGITARLGLKDIDLALAAADAAEIPLPTGAVLRDRLLSAIEHGDGDRDWAVLGREQLRAAETKINRYLNSEDA